MIPRLALLARDEFDYATAKADCCLTHFPIQYLSKPVNMRVGEYEVERR
jgi:hypothetical protein